MSLAYSCENKQSIKQKKACSNEQAFKFRYGVLTR